MEAQISRNCRCPCGSGRKYKRCCWKYDQILPITFSFEVCSSIDQNALKDLKKSLFTQWMDSECLSLECLTPRQAARDPAWHPALRIELFRMEEIEETIVHPSARFELTFLWEALGIQRTKATVQS